MALFIVTIKLPKNPDHDPKHKQTGKCPLSDRCTDVTGEHHSAVVEADNAYLARQKMRDSGYNYITRVEAVTS